MQISTYLGYPKTCMCTSRYGFLQGEIPVFESSLDFSVGEIQTGATKLDFYNGEIHICIAYMQIFGLPKYEIVDICMHRWISPMGKSIFVVPVWISPSGKSKLVQKLLISPFGKSIYARKTKGATVSSSPKVECATLGSFPFSCIYGFLQWRNPHF